MEQYGAFAQAHTQTPYRKTIIRVLELTGTNVPRVPGTVVQTQYQVKEPYINALLYLVSTFPHVDAYVNQTVYISQYSSTLAVHRKKGRKREAAVLAKTKP
jgi:hypothetical protein